MLRALGIAFIICTFLFGALIVVGAGWWAVSSGNVRITGINNQPATSAPVVAPTARAFSNEEYASEPATVPALDMPRANKQPIVRFASNTSVATAVPAPLLPDLDDAKKAELLADLKDAVLVSVIGLDNNSESADLVWRSDSPEQFMYYPSTVTGVIVRLRHRAGSAFSADFTTQPDEDLWSLDAVISPTNTTFELEDSARTLKITYPNVSKGSPFEVGLNNATARSARANVVIATDASVTYTWLNGLYDTGVGTASQSVNVYGNFLKLQYDLKTATRPSFFIARQAVDGQVISVKRVSPVSVLRIADNGDEAPGLAVQFQTRDHFADMNDDETARLFITANKSGSTVGSSILTLIKKPNELVASVADPIVSGTNYGKRGNINYVGTSFRIAVTAQVAGDDLYAVLKSSTSSRPLEVQKVTQTTSQTFNFDDMELTAGSHKITAEIVRGHDVLKSSAAVTVEKLEGGPRVRDIDASAFTLSNQGIIRVQFDRSHPVNPDTAKAAKNYSLKNVIADSKHEFPINDPVVFDEQNNSVELQFSRDLSPGQYVFTVFGKATVTAPVRTPATGITDVVGGTLLNLSGQNADVEFHVAKNTLTDLPLESRGISGLTGKQVEFPEYTKPREYPSGFNPSDKVVTRVARLYYFRDAHRVSQIVNRNVKSYNRATVDMKQQFADAARTKTDNATDERRSLERKAVRSAQEARASENALEEQQQALIKSRDKQRELEDQIGQLDDAVEDLNSKIKAAEDADDKKEKAKLQNQKNGVERNLEQQKRNLDRTDAEVTGISNAIRTLLANVQAKREEEIRETERWEEADAKEQRAAEDQFRREVAAKTEDPDTYAPGNPESNDPVTQVSISVVGEGLIQLRGPRKGVNEVHKIINQLDAPVGQVKVAIHTVQVNGEHGDRLEKVVYRIQRYLDHSRFLTIQSAQMLRNAVVLVASRRAAAVSELVPAGTPQELRDYKYQEAFFGQDFIQELRSMDSEFLKTGNKVLSLSSMDSTSLSNAMFLLSLAKNDVREEILQEFMASVRCKLPADEMEFFLESGPGANRKRGLEKLNFLSCDEPFQFLGQNARFTALRGFFDAHVEGSDTLNPLQREFVRLAQIFKARLITEVELRQRVMERSLIEERIGNVAQKQKQALEQEERAKRELAQSEQNARVARGQLLSAVGALDAQISAIAAKNSAIRRGQSNWQGVVKETLLGIVHQLKEVVKDEPTRERIRRSIESDPDAVFEELFPTGGGAAEGMAIRIYRFVEKNNIQVAALNASTQNSTSKEPLRLDLDSAIRFYRESQDNRKKVEQLQQLWNMEKVREFQQQQMSSTSRIAKDSAGPQLPLELNTEESIKLWSVKKIQAEINVTFKFNGDPYRLNFASADGQTQLTDEHKKQPAWDRFEESVANYETSLRDILQFFKANIGAPADERLTSALKQAGVYLDNISVHQRDSLRDVSRLFHASIELLKIGKILETPMLMAQRSVQNFGADVRSTNLVSRESASKLLKSWFVTRVELQKLAVAVEPGSPADAGSLYLEIQQQISRIEEAIRKLADQLDQLSDAKALADASRRPLDHKKFLDMLVDDVEEKFIELVEGTRAQTSNIDNYLKRLGTALEDDFNAQFYHPAFRHVREQSYSYDVSVGQIETTSIVANNRMFAKVSPQATMEFDLPKRDILINEAMNSAMAAYNDYGALMGDPNFLSLMKMYGGQSPANTFGGQGPSPSVQNVLPGLPSGTDAQFMSSADNNTPRIGSNLEALIPDPAVYKFETGTGYEVRPVIQPDGQSVVFHLDYMFSTNIREPVRADEKHLGRVKRHFINTDVVSGNYELREVSTYRVGLKASRTSRGVPLLEDVPGLGVLFRPQPSAESSLQQNIILSQTVIYPTLFDLMGLRWAPAVADLDSLSLQEREFVSRNREKFLQNEVFDYSSLQVDEFMRVPEAERRGDLYRTQESIPRVHPNSYQGSGLNIQNGQLQEGYSPEQFHPQSQYVPRRSEDAQFSVEQPPRSPVLKVPSAHGLNPQNSGYSEGFVPGTTIPLNSFEGAMPVDPSCIPGQLCPPQHGAMRNDIRLPNTAWPADAGDAKPLLQSSFQQPESVPTLKQGWFCPTESSEPEDQSMSKILPPVTQIHRQAESRTTLFSRRVLGLPGRLMKKLAIRESDSDAGVVNLKPAPGDRKDTTYSQMSRMPR